MAYACVESRASAAVAHPQRPAPPIAITIHMTLYRANPTDGIVWITGASTGLGRQLAIDLAERGFTVAATARDEAMLASLADAAARGSGRIVPFLCDVTDEAGMDRTIAAVETGLGPIALAIFNAGIFSPSHGERLETLNFAATYAVNLTGVVNGLVPVADRMRDRGRGQIAIVGSVTSYFGLPMAAAYGSSKAALNLLAQSLRFDFEKIGITLQIVNPGFIDTPLTARHSFPMPGKISVADASRRLIAGLDRGGFEVAFPRRLVWPMKVLRLLPQSIRHVLMRRLSGWDRRRFGQRASRSRPVRGKPR